MTKDTTTEAFTAADMATAAAQGFRDGAASIAANAGEPVAHLWQHCETGRTRVVMPDAVVDASASWLLVGPLYLHPSPPEGMVGGWRPIETAPKHESVLLYSGGFVPIYCGRKRYGLFVGEPQQDTLAWRCDSSGMFANPTHWMPLPLPPTNPAGSGKGE